LSNAKKACDQAGKDYEVYDSKGTLIYPELEKDVLKVGDTVKINNANATWSTGAKIPAWVRTKTLYVREIRTNGIIGVSTLKTGALTGTIKQAYLDEVSTNTVNINFKPYLVKIEANALNVRNGAGSSYRVNTTVKKGQIYTIVDEKSGWGKLKSGAGWIDLSYTKKM
jgi:uncharacterized protein YgiM (DUF1202 family)